MFVLFEDSRVIRGLPAEGQTLDGTDPRVRDLDPRHSKRGSRVDPLRVTRGSRRGLAGVNAITKLDFLEAYPIARV